jgi:tetraacyldisaccharide 4'-kinase
VKAPAFWNVPDAPAGKLLAPLGWLYAQATVWRLAHSAPWKAPIHVICVGNLTAGGAGKTPVVRDLAARLTAMGRRPGILSRGYGGRLDGPVEVDPAVHTAREVGDEPLLLAKDTPCWIAADRAAGAGAMVTAGIDVIVMDDGLQNPALAQTLKLIVVDGTTGFGNGRPIPAGPLREPVEIGMARADALIVIGEDRHNLVEIFSNRLSTLQVFVDVRNAGWLATARVVAFAGIGRPDKFRATLAAAGTEIAAFRSFADHHPFTQTELTALSALSQSLGAQLVTTEKDWVRLSPEWRSQIKPIEIDLRWRDESAVTSLLNRLKRHG